PTQVGLQDLGSLIAPRAAASDFPQGHFIASPFGTIHAPLITFPRPAGTDLADAGEFRVASLAANDADVTGSIASRALIDPRDDRLVIFPEVNRRLKGDRLVPSERLPAPTPTTSTKPQQGAANEPSEGATFALASVSATPVDVPPRPDDQIKVPVEADTAPIDPPVQPALAEAGADSNVEPDDSHLPSVQMASVYFNVESVGGMGTLQPWTPDAPTLLDAPADEDAAAVAAQKPGETIAPKGQV